MDLTADDMEKELKQLDSKLSDMEVSLDKDVDDIIAGIVEREQSFSSAIEKSMEEQQNLATQIELLKKHEVDKDKASKEAETECRNLEKKLAGKKTELEAILQQREAGQQQLHQLHDKIRAKKEVIEKLKESTGDEVEDVERIIKLYKERLGLDFKKTEKGDMQVSIGYWLKAA